jgi:hypothetical protein
MTVRWDHAPPEVREKVTRRPAARGTWVCSGANGCGEVLTGTYAAAERHANAHGGARLQIPTAVSYGTMSRPQQIELELALIAGELSSHEEAMKSLYARRLALWQEGQSLEPRMTQAQLALPSDVSEAAVTKALRAVRLGKLTPV